MPRGDPGQRSDVGAAGFHDLGACHHQPIAVLVLLSTTEVQSNIRRAGDGMQIDVVEPDQGQQRGLIPALGKSKRIVKRA